MENETILHKIEQVTKEVNNSFSYINAGGCGVFAMLLYKALRRYNIKSSYVLLLSSEVQKEVIEKLYYSNNNNITLYQMNSCLGCYVSHVVLKVNDKYIDSEGVHDNFYAIRKNGFSFKHVEEEFDEQIMENMVNNTEGWNEMFNRNNIPQIKSRINNLMEKRFS